MLVAFLQWAKVLRDKPKLAVSKSLSKGCAHTLIPYTGMRWEHFGFYICEGLETQIAK